MKFLYYDCFAGISGDMNLGALVDVGVPADYVIEELKKLHIDGYELSFVAAQRKGITGTQAIVRLTDETATHHHEHAHTHGETHGHHHEHRNLHDIVHIIESSDLNQSVKTMSEDIFKKVAQAEAKIHGKPLSEVHFHEVGAVDSIVDIVGAAICLDYLHVDHIESSAVEMGGGFVNCAHGTFPVPAPAALEIMRDKPIKLGAAPFEMATPTGVAILSVMVDKFTATPCFAPTHIGYGIGHRDTDIPNVLRVCLGEVSDNMTTATTTEAMMIECNLDDMTPEQVAFVMESLFMAGADDVFLQTIVMKKSRAALQLSVLCNSALANELEQIIMRQTTTLGLRKYPVAKTALNREVETMTTPWGDVRIKTGWVDKLTPKHKPEYEDCAECARKGNVPISEIYHFIQQKYKI